MSRPTTATGWSATIAAFAAMLAILAGGLLRERAGSPERLPLEHSNIGYSIAEGLGYANPFGVRSGPTAWVPPAFPLIYAGAIDLSKATGLSERAVVIAANMAAVVCALWLVLSFCAEDWFPSGRWVVCGAFAAYGILDPDFLVSTGAITALETAFFLAALLSGNSGLTTLAIACALLASTHPGLALGAVMVTAARVCGAREDSRVRIGRLLALGAAMAGVLSVTVPWMARNHRVFGEWIPSKSNGCFELVLSQNETRDGVLTESAIIAGHPSTNPRLQASYVSIGEKKFLEPFQAEARHVVKDETGTYVLFCLDRLFNALCLCASPSDVDLMEVQVSAPDAARLVGRRLALFCVGVPRLLWPRQAWSEPAELSALKEAGVGDSDALAIDWKRAQSAIAARSGSQSAVLTGFAWSGLPTCFLLAAALLSFRRHARVLPVVAALYLIALVPNILITHDERHQANFSLIFAIFAACAYEAGRRRCKPSPTERPAQ